MEMLATMLRTRARAPMMPKRARVRVDVNSLMEFKYSSLIFFIKRPPFQAVS